MNEGILQLAEEFDHQRELLDQRWNLLFKALTS